MTTKSFQHITPPLRLFHGEDSLSRLEPELGRLNCQRAVIVCGASLQRDGPLLERARSALGDRCTGVFAGVKAHSPVKSVIDASAELTRLNADAVVAIGGGSAIVTARGAAILQAEGTDVRALATVPDGKGGLKSPRLAKPKLPQFIIPTTPTTAMVKAGTALFDTEAGERRALFDPKTRAHAIFVDPKMLLSAPRPLVTSSALNTFATAIEGLLSRSGNPLADALLMHAVRLLQINIEGLATRDDADLRSELVLAAVLCGQGTDHTGAGITTVLGHAIGARFHIDNGIANAIVMPHVLRFNAEAGAVGLSKVATAMSLKHDDTQAALGGILRTIEALWRGVDVPHRLRDAGLTFDALPGIARASMDDWFLRGNPRPVDDASQLIDILEQSW